MVKQWLQACLIVSVGLSPNKFHHDDFQQGAGMARILMGCISVQDGNRTGGKGCPVERVWGQYSSKRRTQVRRRRRKSKAIETA